MTVGRRARRAFRPGGAVVPEPRSPDPGRASELDADELAAPDRGTAMLSFARLRVALLFVAVAVAACLMPAQADTYWHLRAGQDLFRTGHVPLTDSYSHTARGLPWPDHEWLWQALSYAAFRAGGMPLLTALGALLCTASSMLSFRLMRPATPAVNFALALFGIALASVVWAVRPQVASLFFLMALISLLARRRLWPLPLLFLVWANLHGAVALGGAVLVAATGLSAFHDGTRARGRCARLAATTVACGVSTALTPLGVGLWSFIGASMARSRSNQIVEWMPAWAAVGPIEAAFFTAAAALVALTAWRWRRLRSWDDRLVVAMAVLLLPLAVRAVRNISPFALLWMPAMSRLLRPPVSLPAPVLAPRSGSADARGEADHPAANALVLLCAVGAGAVAVATAWATRWEHLGWQPVPAGVPEALHHCPGNLYNRYNEGGYLIWFAPDVPVFIDSRQDPYPPDLMRAAAAAERSGDFAPLFARHAIGCAVLPLTSPVAAALTRAGWTALYRDASWLVAARPDLDLPAAVRLRER